MNLKKTDYLEVIFPSKDAVVAQEKINKAGNDHQKIQELKSILDRFMIRDKISLVFDFGNKSPIHEAPSLIASRTTYADLAVFWSQPNEFDYENPETSEKIMFSIYLKKDVYLNGYEREKFFDQVIFKLFEPTIEKRRYVKYLAEWFIFRIIDKSPESRR